MKRAFLPALFLIALFALPSRSQEKVDLQAQVELLRTTVEAHQARITELDSYVATLKTESAKLGQALAKAKKAGFLFAAPNIDAKAALFQGLDRYARSAAGQKVESGPEVAKR